MTETCFICGDDSKKKLYYTLKCNHKAHYECLMKSFKSSKDIINSCPYCREPHGLLPMVNGLKEPLKNIHYFNYEEYKKIKELNIQDVKCQYIIKSGKNKGNECGNKCILGYNFCGRHNK